MLQILINGVDYSGFYLPRSMSLTSRTGADRTTGTISFGNCVAPDEEAEVIVWDSPAQLRVEMAGRIKRCKQYIAGADPAGIKLANGTYSIGFLYDVEVGGYSRDIAREPLTNRVYENKTTGFVFRDLATFLPGFDASAIPIDGIVLKVFETHHDNVAKCFDRLALEEGRQWWVDFRKVLHFEPIQNKLAPFELTDFTYAQIAGRSLTAEPDTENLANELKCFYKSKYSDGQVNVFNNGNEISGIGTLWLAHIAPGSKFRLQTLDTDVITGAPIYAEYTVEAVLSDVNIRLSSNYGERTQSSTQVTPNGPINYIIDDIPRATTVADFHAQQLLQALQKPAGTGKAGRIVPDPGGDLTFKEMKAYLNSVLAVVAYPTVNINFKSTSWQIPGDVQAGMALRVFLTQWRTADIYLQIRQITKKDQGGLLTDGSPLWSYDFKIEVNLYDLGTRLKRIEDEGKKGKIEAAVIDDVIGNYEAIQIKEISGVLTPVQLKETVRITSTYMLIDVVRAVWGRSRWGRAVW